MKFPEFYVVGEYTKLILDQLLKKIVINNLTIIFIGEIYYLGKLDFTHEPAHTPLNVSGQDDDTSGHYNIDSRLRLPLDTQKFLDSFSFVNG